MQEQESDSMLFDIDIGENMTEIIAAAVIIFFLILVFFVGGVLATGVILGLISSFGFGILFLKARGAAPAVYQFMVKHPFMTDAFTTALGYMIFGLSVNGMIAAAVFSIVNTVMLMVANKYDPVAQMPDSGSKLNLNFLNRYKQKPQPTVVEAQAVEVQYAA